VRVGRQARRQVDSHDRNAGCVDIRDHGLDEAGHGGVQAGAENGVDDERATAELREMKLPRLAVVDLGDRDAQASEDVEVRPRVATDLGDAANQKDRHGNAALRQRPRDDESIASIVAAAAQHADMALGQIRVHRFHRGDGLASGVLHEDERRDADVFDGAPIRVAHLR